MIVTSSSDLNPNNLFTCTSGGRYVFFRLGWHGMRRLLLNAALQILVEKEARHTQYSTRSTS